jgi:hypothetical protein
MKIKNNIPINGSIKKLARQDKNLTLFLGDNQAARQFAIENSVCCGLGRKRVNWINNKGVPTKVTFPFTLPNDAVVNDNQELAKELTNILNSELKTDTDLDGGYIVLVDSCSCFYVLGAAFLKNEKGQLLDTELKKTFPEAVSLDFSKIIREGKLLDN